ncbi:MAG: hypothetical protein COZ06_37855 [Armatimonadetes bacterium CG_4_10_14_3_um_filter_66_18]|nr:hypothetical protein [Armatimonadota bacterium]OIP11925.1 MAG: hypothetical protein AUJ96_01290 [Armatimonadetes bacterium CG2_30_66_41]PIU89715.1 MAG: hypothetical protein COS65_27675 [Armatimonadetes bacterium CG06_land_8_20_14_3_00_66_21]PIX46459.1 MAG: hypothetical protein COZ57_11970 [Armatimonadetes bacterium CG_4_8_14_3_um_filter_66_20]PIY35627.1 MAG: hypothetical protein COZ06_37855 [Armatimonadetes bacterium CG_4_10_14_3_um_filter_66_18]PJB63582.1 MAG: hypothetical protein CO096_21
MARPASCLTALALTVACLVVPRACSADFARSRDAVAELCLHLTGYDPNGDGRVEIERLQRVAEGADFPGERAGGGDGLVLVLVEERLLSPLPEGADLRPALTQYVADLAAAGPDVLLLSLAVYAGEAHQDGRTVLAIREFFRQVQQRMPGFRGAVLVGNFPDALLVRQYFWRLHQPTTLNQGKPNERKFEQPLDYWRTRAEPIAMRSELVLSDLDGRWEDCYHEAREALPYVIAAFPDGAEQAGGVTADFEEGTDAFEDFFFLDDGAWKEEPAGDGKRKFTCLGERNKECSTADLTLTNPLARPDIAVARVNARNAAVNPDPAIVDAPGHGLLDDTGKPQTLTFESNDKTPPQRSFWIPDAKLERQLLAEYFERNHRYRTGAFNADRRPASLTTEWGSSLAEMKRAFPEWATFAEPGYDVAGANTDLLECVRWLKRPALLRALKAHSDPWGATLANTDDLDALHPEVGGTVWNWQKKGNQLIPSLADTSGKLDFAVDRTLYENGALPDCANMFLLTGCDSISPGGAMTKPFNDPQYAFWQGAECHLLYLKGLVSLARAKVFNDEPREFCQTLADGGNWGDAWRRYFELESADAALTTLDEGIRRKKAYFWSLVGDWTLTMYPEGVARPQ